MTSTRNVKKTSTKSAKQTSKKNAKKTSTKNAKMASIKNPLELPEIRTRISLFVTLKDAVACVRVCKDWADTFAYPIWHTIDFTIHKNLDTLGPSALSKYSQHIRVVKSMGDYPHISAVLWSMASRIRQLGISMQSSGRIQTYFHDVIRVNNSSLTSLTLIASPSSEVYFTPDSMGLAHSSQISFIKLRGLQMSRGGFCSMLKICPLLATLDIRDTVLMWSPDSELYQHPKITTLIAPVAQIFQVNPKNLHAPSLLTQLPCIKEWRTWSLDTEKVALKTIKDEFSRCCPLLQAVCVELPSAAAAEVYVHAFQNLTKVCILHNSLSAELLMAILSHQATLVIFMTYTPSSGIYDQEEVPEVNMHFQTFTWMALMPLRLCPKLTTFYMSMYEFGIEELEQAISQYDVLKDLRIRIRNLDTAEKVDHALQMWVDGIRHRRSNNNNLDGMQKEGAQDTPISVLGNLSIEERVAQYLLRYKNLECIWLGTRVYRM
ncbi:hypothetical protein EDD11_008429 [Mortierella claussenii]|nr:hypothetical protein EDD11_008429 [Mortierella claussenii]